MKKENSQSSNVEILKNYAKTYKTSAYITISSTFLLGLFLSRYVLKDKNLLNNIGHATLLMNIGFISNHFIVNSIYKSKVKNKKNENIETKIETKTDTKTFNATGKNLTDTQIKNLDYENCIKNGLWWWNGRCYRSAFNFNESLINL